MRSHIGAVNPVRARQQHAALLRTVRQLGGRVVVLPFVHGAFDSVFAKDNAIYMTRGDRPHALLANPRHQERKAEQCARTRDLRQAGLEVVTIAAAFEGGDVHLLPQQGRALLGHGFRSSPEACRPLEQILGTPIVTLELVDPALYHLDTALAVLDDGTALVCDDAFSLAARRTLRTLGFRDVISISREETLRFALNFIEVGDAVVTGTESPEVAEVLESLGKQVIALPLDEFHHAGGSAACLLGRVHDLAAQAMVMQAPIAAMRSTAA